jgi:hypothetical protein
MVAHTIIPAFGKLRQKDCKFEVSLRYIGKTCLKKITNQTNEQTKSKNKKGYLNRNYLYGICLSRKQMNKQKNKNCRRGKSLTNQN